MSENAYSTDTRFFTAADFVRAVEEKSCKKVVHTIAEAEKFGQNRLEKLIISPCTGNTLAKIANGITDTPVCMAAKAHLRNNKPLIIALATNDALSSNLKNIATLLSRKSVYFVPMMQDDLIQKPHSLVADFSMLRQTLELAMEGKQYPKIFK